MGALIERLAWQDVLFAPRLRRTQLAGLVPSWECRSIRLHIVRNEPFELVGAALPAFLAYAGLRAELSYGPYDDSLSDPGAGTGERCDAVIVWLAMDRYDEQLPPDQLARFVAGRVAVLRRRSESPVLVANWAASHDRAAAYNAVLAGLLGELPGVHLCDQAALAGRLGEDYDDARLASLGGSRLSDRGCLETARQFGLVWLPSVLVPPIKAVVVDLDQTLYRGILSEDGAAGIEITGAHLDLQRELLSCRARGVYLAIASKNDPEEVDALFEARRDLVLRPEHLSAAAVGWGSKADSVALIAERLHIGLDALLLLDDNAAELAEVSHAHPGVQVVLAADADSAAAVLRRFPGLLSFTVSETARRRIADLAAAERREEARAGASGDDDYLESLDMRLHLAVDPPGAIDRLHELSNRVNQFNTGLLRLSEAQVAAYVNRADRCAVTVALRDAFSDSGIVAGLFARKDGDAVVVDEIDISCRALGRRLEPVIVAEAVLRAAGTLVGQGRDCPLDTYEVRLGFRAGPRNGAARDCLVALCGELAPEEGVISWQVSIELVESLRRSVPVEVRDSAPTAELSGRGT